MVLLGVETSCNFGELEKGDLIKESFNEVTKTKKRTFLYMLSNKYNN